MASIPLMVLLRLPPSLWLITTSLDLMHRFSTNLPFTCQHWILSLLSRVSGLKSYPSLLNPAYSVVKEPFSTSLKMSSYSFLYPLLCHSHALWYPLYASSQKISMGILFLFLCIFSYCASFLFMKLLTVSSVPPQVTYLLSSLCLFCKFCSLCKEGKKGLLHLAGNRKSKVLKYHMFFSRLFINHKIWKFFNRTGGRV